MPASNAKLFVGAAALEEFGPDFRFETSVYAEGRVNSSTGQLQGNLILVGSGDPNVDARPYVPDEALSEVETPPSIIKIVDQLQSQGIRSILGDIVADDSYFVREPWAESWELEDLAWGYGAPVSSLALNENCFLLRILPGKAPRTAAIHRALPVNPGVHIANHIRTVAHNSPVAVSMERSPDGETCTFEGEIPSGHSGLQYSLPINDPALFAASQLKTALEQRRINVSGKAIARTLPRLLMVDGHNQLSPERALEHRQSYLDANKLASIRTLRLEENLKRMMKSSRNLYAEMLLRSLGARLSGVGSIDTGVAALGQFLNSAGIDPNSWFFSDASGLSRKDVVTPETIVKLLAYMYERPSRDRFRSLLPVSGLDGTLKFRMREEEVANRIFAKTGSLDLVSSLSGYAYTKDGKNLAFSIITNHETAPAKEIRKMIDEICHWMIEHDFEPGGDLGSTRNQ